MTSRKLEDRLERLRQLRTATPDPEVGEIVRKSLLDKSNLVVAEAAKVVGALRITSLIPDLLNAFDRLFEDPVKTDSKCWGKTAIAKALTELEYDQSPPFVRGSRHIQMEPVWGGQEDTALQLRSTCVLALVQCADLRRVEIMRHLVDAMTDEGDPVRVEAVRALGQMGGDDSTLLLRLKARHADVRPLIVGHVFDTLIELESEIGAKFVSGYLDASNVEVRDEAALSLGASRRQDALRLLMDRYSETPPSPAFRAVLLRAISSSRDPAAIDFLLEIVRSARLTDAQAALEALSLHKDSEDIQARVAEAQRQRDPAIRGEQ